VLAKGKEEKEKKRKEKKRIASLLTPPPSLSLPFTPQQLLTSIGCSPLYVYPQTFNEEESRMHTNPSPPSCLIFCSKLFLIKKFRSFRYHHRKIEDIETPFRLIPQSLHFQTLLTHFPHTPCGFFNNNNKT